MAAISYNYAIPYLIVFMILCYLYWKEKKGYTSTGRIAFFVMLIFIGLRGHIYSDYISYYAFYKDLPPIFDLNKYLSNSDYEQGFVIYSSAIKTIFPNYFLWVFINTVIDLSVFYWIFKKYSASIVLSFIVFMAFKGLAIEFNLYRNSKAIILFLLSVPYIRERKLLPYLCLNIAGCMFHLSSILYIPLYFIVNKKFSKYFIWSVFVLINVIFFLHISLSDKILNFVMPILGMEQASIKVTNYLIDGEAYTLSLGYIERTFAFIIFAIFYNSMVNKNDYNRIFYNSFFIYYLLFGLFSDVRVFTERFPLLLIFSYWILYPNVLNVLSIKSNRKIFTFIILLLSMMKVVSENSNIMAMYDNLLLGIMPYEERCILFDNYFDLL